MEMMRMRHGPDHPEPQIGRPIPDDPLFKHSPPPAYQLQPPYDRQPP